MWIFTRYGFYSIACARKKNGKLASSKLVVRARQKRHLEALIRRFPNLAPKGITATYETDYRYRITVPKAVWSRTLAQLAKEQSWSNFKDEAARYLGPHQDDYRRALEKIGNLTRELQENEPISLDREMLIGLRDFGLLRATGPDAPAPVFRTWQEHFGLPPQAADVAARIAAYWRQNPGTARTLTVPEDCIPYLDDRPDK